jgi:hypothetical protein
LGLHHGWQNQEQQQHRTEGSSQTQPSCGIPVGKVPSMGDHAATLCLAVFRVKPRFPVRNGLAMANGKRFQGTRAFKAGLAGLLYWIGLL